MIYTVTFNPSLDYIVHVDDLALGSVNRTETEELYPGGKGINVSIVLKNLGLDSVAMGFLSGFTGSEIDRLLHQFGCHTDFIPVSHGFSRINVKIKARKESEINGQGPRISQKEIEALYQKLDALQSGDILVLAGSIPNTLPSDIYERIGERLEGKGIHLVVDATRDLLAKVLKFQPFLIKPNNHELGEIFNVVLKTKAEAIPYARKLQEMGARNVLVSMAGEGGVLVSETGEVLESFAPDGKLVNSVGAGDSMVAGFLYGYLLNHNYLEAFHWGLATGSASACQEWLAKKEDAQKMMEQFG